MEFAVCASAQCFGPRGQTPRFHALALLQAVGAAMVYLDFIIVPLILAYVASRSAGSLHPPTCSGPRLCSEQPTYSTTVH